MAQTTAVNYPKLPENMVWSVDRHNNLFAGPVCSLKIFEYRSHNILGITFKRKREVAYSVTFDENYHIQREVDYLFGKVK